MVYFKNGSHVRLNPERECSPAKCFKVFPITGSGLCFRNSSNSFAGRFSRVACFSGSEKLHAGSATRVRRTVWYFNEGLIPDMVSLCSFEGGFHIFFNSSGSPSDGLFLSKSISIFPPHFLIRRFSRIREPFRVLFRTHLPAKSGVFTWKR